MGAPKDPVKYALYIERLSKSHKGFHPVNEIKKGHKWSKEAVLIRSKKTSLKLKEKGIKPPSRKGTVPWNYKGATLLQAKIRKCFEYRQWRSDIFMRDNFTCQHCDKKGDVLNADHIKEFAKILKDYNIKTLSDALCCSELWSINNGRTLCKPCHQTRKKWDKEMPLLSEL